MLETAVPKSPHCWAFLTFIIRKLKSVFREGRFSLFGLAMLSLTQTAPGWNAGLQSPNQPLVLPFLITMKSIKRKSFTFLRFSSHFLKILPRGCFGLQIHFSPFPQNRSSQNNKKGEGKDSNRESFIALGGDSKTNEMRKYNSVRVY